MNISCIFSAGVSPSILLESFTIIQTVLEELSVVCEPFFYKSEMDVYPLLKKIEKEKGFIVAFDTQDFAPASSILHFLEEVEEKKLTGAFEGKKVLLVTASLDESEMALSIVAKKIEKLGANVVLRVFIPPSFARQDISKEDKQVLTEVLEKQTEDFYRLLRQERTYFPKQNSIVEKVPHVTEETPEKVEAKRVIFDTFEEPSKPTMQEIEEKYKEAFESTGEIEALTNQLKEKLEKLEEPLVSDDVVVVTPYTFTNEFDSKNKKETLEQKTHNLVRYYNPLGVPDLDAIFEFDITGDETFISYITIKDQECFYQRGKAENSDIKIISDDLVWQEVLDGKISAQKAFMTGQVKVRGNFVLLTQFEQIFSL